MVIWVAHDTAMRYVCHSHAQPLVDKHSTLEIKAAKVVGVRGLG